MLQNDIRLYNNNFIIPKTDVGDEVTSPTSQSSSSKPSLRVGTRSTPPSSHRQQSHGNFISYPKFLTSYWGHLDERLTQTLGEE